jgi:hypothetical protein
MGRKTKLYEEVMVDHETGEVETVTWTTVQEFNETFGCYRMTNGIGWMKMFDLHEILLVTALGQYEDYKTHVIAFTTSVRKAACDFLKVSNRTMYRIINSLVGKHVIIKMTRDEFLLNPAYFFRGGSKELLKRIQDFYKLYNDKYGASASFEEDVAASMTVARDIEN